MLYVKTLSTALASQKTSLRLRNKTTSERAHGKRTAAQTPPMIWATGVRVPGLVHPTSAKIPSSDSVNIRELPWLPQGACNWGEPRIHVLILKDGVAEWKIRNPKRLIIPKNMPRVQISTSHSRKVWIKIRSQDYVQACVHPSRLPDTTDERESLLNLLVSIDWYIGGTWMILW